MELPQPGIKPTPPAVEVRNLNHLTTRWWLHFFPFFFFWLRCVACGILVPRPGIEPGPSAGKARSPNHWTAREFPGLCYLSWVQLTLEEAETSWEPSLLSPETRSWVFCIGKILENEKAAVGMGPWYPYKSVLHLVPYWREEFPQHQQAMLRYQQRVLQFNSILTPSTWR